MKTETMDSKTAAAIAQWVKTDGGDTEKTARWMADSLKVAGVRECRKMIAEAMQIAA